MPFAMGLLLLFKLPPMKAILLNLASRGFGEGHLAEIGNKIDAMHHFLRVNPVGLRCLWVSVWYSARN
jgi:hypothetical protein